MKAEPAPAEAPDALAFRLLCLLSPAAFTEYSVSRLRNTDRLTAAFLGTRRFSRASGVSSLPSLPSLSLPPAAAAAAAAAEEERTSAT